MKVDTYVSTWRVWGFYIQCLKELTFAKSKSLGNNCPFTTVASSSPTRTITGHIKNHTRVMWSVINTLDGVTLYQV